MNLRDEGEGDIRPMKCKLCLLGT